MKADCLIENVEKYSSLLSRILPAHAQVPIFSNILIESNKEGLYLSATDLELGIRVKIPGKIEEEGSITVPGRQFIEIINSLPKDKVSFYTEKETFFIHSRSNKVSLQTIPSAEFPDLFQKKDEEQITFDKKEFKEVFSKLIFAASTDETRPVLTGILLSQKDKQTNFVSTDGYRLSVKQVKKTVFSKEDEDLILSARFINEALLLKPEKEKMIMYILRSTNQAVLEVDDVVLVGRLIEGNFPSYEKVIPQSTKTTVEIDKEEFAQSLRLSSVFAKESANIVKFKIENNTVKLFSKASGLGEGEADIEVKQEGEDNEISFNVKFVLDLLRNIDEEKLILEMNSPTEPGLFKLPKDEEFLHIIMPVRVQE